MRHIKAFENFFGQSPDLGRFSEEESQEQNNPLYSSEEPDEQDWSASTEKQEKEEECEPCGEEGTKEEEEEHVWGDEVIDGHNDPSTPSIEGPVYVESFAAFFEGKKKVNAGLQAYLDKKNGKKEDKKEDKGGKKAKPDFLDLDKDGDKKESMKKAAKDAKEKDSKEDKGDKGLSAAQKKLPAALQKAILARKKK